VRKWETSRKRNRSLGEIILEWFCVCVREREREREKGIVREMENEKERVCVCVCVCVCELEWKGLLEKGKKENEKK